MISPSQEMILAVDCAMPCRMPSPGQVADTPAAAVIDFERERARRVELNEAAGEVARQMEAFEAGEAPFAAVLAALVAPFNAAPDDPDESPPR